MTPQISWLFSRSVRAPHAPASLLLFLLFVAASVLTETSSAQDHSADVLARLSGNVREATLSNGIRVTLYRRGAAPVFAGVVAVRVGGTDEPEGATGIAHLLEHMAFKGTDTLGTKDFEREKRLLEKQEEIMESLHGKAPNPEQQQRLDQIQKQLDEVWERESFSREVEKRGASGLNATTDKEMTKYFVNLPRSSFEFWCWIESERILNPVFRQFYQERDVVMEERRMRYEDDPQGKLYEKLLNVAYTAHPYRHPVIGYERDIRGLTARMLQDFQRQYYVGSNIALSVVGDVDHDRDIAMLERYFGRVPAGTPPKRPATVEPSQKEERVFTLPFRASPEVLLAYHKPAYPDPHDAPISVMEEILAGSSVSPLYEELVKKQRVAVRVDVEEGPGIAYPNLIFFGVVPRAPHSGEEAVKAFDEVVARFAEAGPTEEQLVIAKRALALQSLNEFRSNLSLALNMATSHMIYGDWRAFLNWHDEVMKVTADDVRRMTQQYLVKSNRTIGYLEKEERVAHRTPPGTSRSLEIARQSSQQGSAAQ